MRLALAAAGVLLIALTGCTGAGPGQGEQADGTDTSGPVESVVPLGDPIATREITSGEATYALDLYPLRRNGEMVHLDARVRYLQIGRSSDRALLAGPQGLSQVGGATDGFRLVDSAAAKIYLPARYGNDEAACSPRLSGNADAGDETYVTCIFGAPQSATVEVQAARFGSFPGVEIR
ncbi:MAG: hypothetical protein Q4F67_02900 [Propionibacteriaceae bacterium]|nr:hypothetical protein [Propionibacteriaceae bacterium]